MSMSLKEIKAWRDKEQERLPSISNEIERDWSIKTIQILSAVLQDD
jgi:hypothetical protein